VLTSSVGDSSDVSERLEKSTPCCVWFRSRPARRAWILSALAPVVFHAVGSLSTSSMFAAPMTLS
jgi:hypothetical protein